MTDGCFLGTDVGGTFTDLVFYTASGERHCFKVPSTPAQPGAGILTGIDEVKTTLGLDDQRIGGDRAAVGVQDRLDAGLGERWIATPARIARSNGGAELARTHARRPRTRMSRYGRRRSTSMPASCAAWQQAAE